MGAGCNCTGISKADWIRCFGRWKRFAHTDSRHWCPRCLAQAGLVLEDWEPALPGMEAPTTSYKRNSGKIPHTEPHRYAGNLDLFARHARGSATAVLVQGDSRRLCEVLEGARAEGLISSPPYDETLSAFAHIPEKFWEENARKWGRPAGKRGRKTDKYSTDPSNLGNMPTGEPPSAIVSSPPFGAKEQHTGGKPASLFKHLDGRTASRKLSGMPTGEGYSTNPDNLGTMPTGEPPQCILSSPPYATQTVHDRCDIDPDKLTGNPPGPHSQALTMANYGDSDGQLGTMPAGEPPQAVIASPPFVGTELAPGDVQHDSVEERKAFRDDGRRPAYGRSDGQLAAMREGDVDAVIASPPWQSSSACEDPNYRTDRQTSGGPLYNDYGDSDGQLAALPEGEPPQVDGIVASPPYGQAGLGKVATYKDPEKLEKEIARALAKGGVGSYYGNAPGQLGVMQEGEPPSTLKQRLEASILRALRKGLPPQMIVSSPPYAESLGSTDMDFIRNRLTTGPSGSTKLRGAKGAQSDGQTYGTDARNLGNMREDEPPAGIVASPPWESSVNVMDESNARRYNGWAKNDDGSNRLSRSFLGDGYGITDGNIGNQQGDTFWSAARAILLQCHAVLAPGGVAIWVLKAFVRNKAIVDFPGQWEALCNSCGFETIEVIRAWLVEDRGAQFALNGDLVEKKVARKSFFRRLHEKKYPDLAIDYEIVLVTRKPDGEVLEGARAEGIISSPPYSPSGLGHDTGEMGDAKRAELGLIPDPKKIGKAYMAGRRYSTDARNLGNMPTGEPPKEMDI